MHRALRGVVGLAFVVGMTIVGLQAGAATGATGASSQAHHPLPVNCIEFNNHCYEPCYDPSDMCPPSDDNDLLPSYSWVGSNTGNYWQDEFTGSSVNTDVWQVQGAGGGYPAGGGATDQLFEPGGVTVSGGELQLSTYYDSSGTYSSDCQTYFSTNDCWISGGIIQCGSSTQGTCTSSYEPWISAGQVAVEAKVTTAVSGVDSDLQLGGYGWGNQSSTTYGPNCNIYTSPECSWPPEQDFMENGGSTLANFSATLHCADQNPPSTSTDTQDTYPTISDYLKTGGVGVWNTYEVDWTSSWIKIFVNGSGPVFQAAKGGNLTGAGQSTYKLNCPSAYWPPNPAAAMGIFLQQSVLGTPPSHSDTSALDVDWVAETS